MREANPSTWIAVNPGDKVAGKLLEVTAAWSDIQYDGRNPNSGYYPLLRIEVTEADGYTAGEVLAVHCFATVLRDRILTHEPVPGETLIITYEGEGEAKTRGRNAPQLYRVDMPDRNPEQAAAKAYSQFTRGRASQGQQPTPVQGDIPVEAYPAQSQGEQTDIPF